MYKRFNPPVLCESREHVEQGVPTFMTFVESKMEESKHAVYNVVYMLVFKCEDCEATATIIADA